MGVLLGVLVGVVVVLVVVLGVVVGAGGCPGCPVRGVAEGSAWDPAASSRVFGSWLAEQGPKSKLVLVRKPVCGSECVRKMGCCASEKPIECVLLLCGCSHLGRCLFETSSEKFPPPLPAVI